MSPEERIFQFFKEKKRAKDLAFDTDLFRGGYVDSLFAFEIIQFIEDEFRVSIANRDITEKNFKTIAAIARLVAQAGGK